MQTTPQIEGRIHNVRVGVSPSKLTTLKIKLIILTNQKTVKTPNLFIVLCKPILELKR